MHAVTGWILATIGRGKNAVKRIMRLDGPERVLELRTDGTPAPADADTKKPRQGNLAEFLLASPLSGSDIDVERLRD